MDESKEVPLDSIPSNSSELQLEVSSKILPDILDENKSQLSCREDSTPSQKQNSMEIPNILQPLPTNESILINFEEWLTTMDGGCQYSDISYKSKLVIQKLIGSIGIERVMDPKIVYRYYEKNEEISVATTSVYLRYLSSFILYLHEEFSGEYSTEKHYQMEMRISR